MVEMFTLFPHESAAVMQRGIEFGILCSSLLVLHCARLVLWSPSCEGDGRRDLLLRGLCLARIALAAPRPYFWIRTRRLFVQARCQPTPQLVTQRLLDIYEHPFGLERSLLLFYYGWLALATLLAWSFRRGAEQANFAQQLWQHCLLNYASVVLHRVLCVLLFYHLMRSNLRRGIPPEVLEKYSKRLIFRGSTGKEHLGSGDMECSICFGAYIEGEGIRKLTCSHHFHQRCVDVWLLGHQNRCPLCLEVVGPQQ